MGPKPKGYACYSFLSPDVDVSAFHLYCTSNRSFSYWTLTFYNLRLNYFFLLILISKLGLQGPVGYINVPSETCQFCKRAASSLCLIHLGNTGKVQSQQGAIVPKTRWLLSKHKERSPISTVFSQSCLMVR